MTSYSFPEVADLVSVSVRTVEFWHASGELRAVNVSRNRQSRRQRLRVLQVDLDAFLAGRATDATPGRKPRRRRKRLEVEQFV